MNNLVFTAQQYRQLQAHLFPGDGLEALAFCLATQVESKNGIRFLVTETYLIPHDQCDRSDNHLTWNTRDIVEILNLASDQGKSVIKIHSHPRGPRAFSAQDDISDLGFFPSVKEWCAKLNSHCSVVFTEDFIVARMFNQRGKFEIIDNVWVLGASLKLYPNRKGIAFNGYDESTYEIFRGLRVGIVGLSGTGGWISEYLGRNEVGHLALCDSDKLEQKNLNRIPNSRLELCGKNKIDVAADAVKAMGLGTTVALSCKDLQTPESIELMKSCDVIFGCVDSVFARHVLNTLCTYYMIPLFDIGVHIESLNGEIRSAVSGFEYIIPGESSLLSRGIYTPKDLADETFKLTSASHYDRLEKEGYIRGKKVARPAVVSINSFAATMCFEEFQARILNYRWSDDDNVASKVFCAKSGEIIIRKESEFPKDKVLMGKIGLGDEFIAEQGHLLSTNRNESTAST